MLWFDALAQSFMSSISIVSILNAKMFIEAMNYCKKPQKSPFFKKRPFSHFLPFLAAFCKIFRLSGADDDHVNIAKDKLFCRFLSKTAKKRQKTPKMAKNPKKGQK